MNLDSLEFRSPLVDIAKPDVASALGGQTAGLLVGQVWQRRLRSLWEYVQQSVIVVAATASRTIGPSDKKTILLCSGSITLTLPANNTSGDSYYFFNNDTGVIAIAGTINGNASGYKLVNQYQYVQLTNIGASWIVTANN